ncbi:DNA polymerase I, partial [Candidatus Dependentiae bacterium]|nr:DNA polymerase I [Candidatus Dependentiae bacterium]
MKRKRLFIIDAYSLIYKSYYAIKNLSTKEGFQTNAIYGFVRSIMKVLKVKSPDYFIIAFDSKKPSFRKDLFSEYKANRPVMPEDLQDQIPIIKDLVKAFSIDSIEIPGYEADDLIGVLSTIHSVDKEVSIVSSDKDLYQLVNDNVCVLDLQKDIEINRAKVIDKFGVPPEKIPELFGLAGDTSDNIPGVMGVGVKTGSKLISEYGTLEKLYENVENIKGKLKDKLIRDKDNAFLSRDLATIKTVISEDIDLNEYHNENIDRGLMEEILTRLEFISILNDLFPDRTGFTGDYGYITEVTEFDDFISRISKSEKICIDLETTGIDPISAEIVGISISDSPEFGRYIPIRHDEGDQLEPELILSKLKLIFEDEKIKKIGHNLKYEYIILSRYGIKLSGIYMDTMIAAYLLTPTNPRTGLDAVSLEYLHLKKTPIKKLIGEKKSTQKSFSEVLIEDAYNYACEDVDAPLRLEKIFHKELIDLELFKLMEELEIPLVSVLAEVEMNGVKVDLEHLSKLEKIFQEKLKALTIEIYNLSGTEFNINSPKQLSKVLFEDLKLPSKKRTKSGLSTDIEVLTKLAEDYPIAEKLLEFRKHTKLLSTYVIALEGLVNERTGRIHTSFNQAVTATGRLSSSNPNLQNIPIKTEEGREIRKAFIPGDKDHILISADYSQIELRFLAHFSEDPELVEAFNKNLDVHSRTAALIFDIFPEFVTSEQRRIAKKVNFGIVYGQTPYGLSKELGISPKKAKQFIANYFERYKRVELYIRDTIECAKEQKFIRTILGRIRHIPELFAKNANIRSFGERIAVNTQLQGSAADLIKKALIEIHSEFKRLGLQTKIILQVHDELVFDVPLAEVEDVKRIVRDKMENSMK